MLNTLPSPPGDTLKDTDIREASKHCQNWDTNFKILRKIASQAKEHKGAVLTSKAEEEKEARRILKASWRAFRRH